MRKSLRALMSDLNICSAKRASPSGSIPPSARARCSCPSAAGPAHPDPGDGRPSSPCSAERPRPAPSWPGAIDPCSPSRAPTTARIWRWWRACPSWWPRAAAEHAYLTFQEYFERLGTDPKRWGKPLAALLGALDAQMELGIAAIGGKDCMSGTFEDMDVPPTLVCFAVAAGQRGQGRSAPEFKRPARSWCC